MKPLKDLTLLDRFLFSETMEDPENLQTMLEIILGKEIVLQYLPQTGKRTEEFTNIPSHSSGCVGTGSG